MSDKIVLAKPLSNGYWKVKEEYLDSLKVKIAIKELSAVVLLIDAIMDIGEMQGLKNTIQQWITDLEEGVEHE